MTVESQTVKIIGTGNGVATTFSFSPMSIFDSTQLLVTHVSATGVETVLLEGTGATTYAVVVTAYPGTGSVRYPEDAVTPLPTGQFLYIKRVLPLKQLTNLENQGGYFPSTQEDTFDKGVMLDLQQQEELDRAIKAPLSDTVVSLVLPIASARASKVLSFTATGAVTATDAGGGGGVTDHGALTGLADDDHTQYLLKIGGALTGAITTSSTFDGRDVSVDGTKLDGIETAATADQTAAEILTAIKTVDGAASGLDADLLDGIEGAGYSILGQIAGINAQTASYTLVLTDKGKLVKVSNASANTLTVPLNASVAFPTNSVVHILREGAGSTTVVATGGVTIRTPATLVLRAQYSMVSLLKIGTDEWVISGDLTA